MLAINNLFSPILAPSPSSLPRSTLSASAPRPSPAGLQPPFQIAVIAIRRVSRWHYVRAQMGCRTLPTIRQHGRTFVIHFHMRSQCHDTRQSRRPEEATDPSFSGLGDIMLGDDWWPSGSDATCKRTCVSWGPTIRPTISLTSQPLISVSSTATSWSPRFICPAVLQCQLKTVRACTFLRALYAAAKSRTTHTDTDGGIPEALAGPLGAMPVMKTSPFAVMPKEMPMPTLSVWVTCAPGIG